ncbi:MAG: hypothetical protein PHO26_00225 [Dehalococcoidia bacterium]|nr:hypothetical protein [Dehalococcoidia bacterium]
MLLSRYYLIPILLVIGVLYLTTYLLARKSIIRISVHRKIWNLLLLITSAACCLLGLLLVLAMDYGIRIRLPFDMTFWHVEAGIAMGMIAAFHICWHWRYLKVIFQYKRRY